MADCSLMLADLSPQRPQQRIEGNGIGPAGQAALGDRASLGNAPLMSRGDGLTQDRNRIGVNGRG